MRKNLALLGSGAAALFVLAGCGASARSTGPTGAGPEGGANPGDGAAPVDGVLVSGDLDGGAIISVTDAAVSGPGGMLTVRILDSAGKPVPARVNVIGSDHAYYQPAEADNPLSGYSLRRQGLRKDRGPARYYGSFFYTEGSFQVRLPPGKARLEVSRGYAYYLSTIEDAEIVAGRETRVDVTLRRLVDMPRAGWYTTDTHMHFDRPDLDDPNLIKVVSADELNFSHSLVGAFVAQGDRSQLDPKLRQGGLSPASYRFGPKSIRSWNDSSMVSGVEHGNGFGHVTLVLMTDLPAASQPNQLLNRGPSMATVYDQTRALSGAMGHAHGGYDGEVLSDVVLGKSDWVELIQFGIIKGGETGGADGVGLARYYQALNTGYRYPIAGASDYPVCRTLADSRSYVMGGAAPSFEKIVGAMTRGESFATSGPLLFLSVNDKGPGNQIDVRGAASQTLTVKMLAVSAYLPLTELELVVGGKVTKFPGSGFSIEKETTVEVSGSTWIAARCHGPHDARAHTNPVWIYFDDQAPFDGQAARALQQNVDRYAAGTMGSQVDQDVNDTLTRAGAKIAGVVMAGKNQKILPNYPRTATTAPGLTGAMVLPAVLPRPGLLPASAIAGTVVDETGAPLGGAMVAAWGRSPATQTGPDGHFQLAGLPGEDPLFLRVSKTGFETTNTSYLNHRCEGACVQIVCPTTLTAEALMKARVPGAAIDDLRSRPWIFINVRDGKGALAAGATPAIQQGTDWSHTLVHGTLGFVDETGAFGGAAAVAKPKGGIGAVTFYPPIGFSGSTDEDNTTEPNVIVSALGKDVVLPVFKGQVTYGVIVDSLAE